MPSITPTAPVPKSGTAVLGIGTLKAPPKRERRHKLSPLSPQEQVAKAMLRSRLYLLLSLGFRYPSRDTVSAMREELEALRTLAKGAAALYGNPESRISDAIERVAQTIRGARFEAVEVEYLHVFTHVITTDCHPCETAYTATHMFQQAQKIADLNGFYRAFGVEPDVERPDHVSVESEFMAYLIQKEARAISDGRPRRASLMRRTQRTFLEDHLGPWVRVFARFVEVKAEVGLFAALAALTQNFFECEFSELSAQVRELSGPPQPLPLLMAKEQEDEDEDCPAFSTAGPMPVGRPMPVNGSNLEVVS